MKRRTFLSWLGMLFASPFVPPAKATIPWSDDPSINDLLCKFVENHRAIVASGKPISTADIMEVADRIRGTSSVKLPRLKRIKK